MLLSTLRTMLPDLYRAAFELQNRVRVFAEYEHGYGELLFEELPLVLEDAQLLSLMSDILRLERMVASASVEGEEWRWIASTVSGGKRSESFLSSTGAVWELDHELVATLSAGRPLDAGFCQEPGDPFLLQITRAGRIEGRLPKSLLRHLLDQRQAGPGTAISQSLTK